MSMQDVIRLSLSSYSTYRGTLQQGCTHYKHECTFECSVVQKPEALVYRDVEYSDMVTWLILHHILYKCVRRPRGLNARLPQWGGLVTLILNWGTLLVLLLVSLYPGLDVVLLHLQLHTVQRCGQMQPDRGSEDEREGSVCCNLGEQGRGGAIFTLITTHMTWGGSWDKKQQQQRAWDAMRQNEVERKDLSLFVLLFFALNLRKAFVAINLWMVNNII